MTIPAKVQMKKQRFGSSVGSSDSAVSNTTPSCVCREGNVPYGPRALWTRRRSEPRRAGGQALAEPRAASGHAGRALPAGPYLRRSLAKGLPASGHTARLASDPRQGRSRGTWAGQAAPAKRVRSPCGTRLCEPGPSPGNPNAGWAPGSLRPGSPRHVTEPRAPGTCARAPPPPAAGVLRLRRGRGAQRRPLPSFGLCFWWKGSTPGGLGVGRARAPRAGSNARRASMREPSRVLK
ncbi:uncharacterized protein LOC102489788 [Tupaia chinensis]|uniref:uncharacterized protein LOC102489788 n=1 Tax=Tupaia chinensis TaxID=246437 RepID=UPI0003C8F55B|nr:uncharacterized protein LOC102489788 [Tupaia chinensis]